MIDKDSPVTEDELHAYVDGELPADRREAVAAWLAAHPEQAATVAAWRAQAEAIRARYGAVADEPVPARLKLEQIMRQGRPRAFAGGARGRGGGRRLRGRRRRRLDGARRIGRGAERAPARSPPTRSRRTSSTSSRCATRSKCRATSART